MNTRLLLKRNVGEGVFVFYQGKPIMRVSVDKAFNDRARLVFEADQSLEIWRDELAEEKYGVKPQ